MTEEEALLAAIAANPDEDTPRLAYADWLDEHRPDQVPPPGPGPSARADYIRVQCRLARYPFDDPDHPELLEREEELALWLSAHADESRPDLSPALGWYGDFDSGDETQYRRGFLDWVYYDHPDGPPDANARALIAGLEATFARSTPRTLVLSDVSLDELSALLTHPVATGLRGLHLDYLLEEDGEDEAARRIAASPHLGNLRSLYLDLEVGLPGLTALAAAGNLPRLEFFGLDYPLGAEEVRTLGRVGWLRHLRELHLWLSAAGDPLRALASFPPMPRLTSLTLKGFFSAEARSVRRFAASKAFPALARLNLSGSHAQGPDRVAALAAGRWPLRRLELARCDVRTAGAEALTRAPFAGTLRVLDLASNGITPTGVRALARSDRLAGLRHLDLSGNPLGPTGLAAIARSAPLRGLRVLDVSSTWNSRGRPAAADVLAFLRRLDMPGLRHLNLGGLPVGVRGSRALADDPKFGSLTRLGLNSCGLGESGAAALVASPHLQNLVELNLYGCRAGKGVARLADRRVMPRLGRCALGWNRVPRPLATRLRRRKGFLV